AIRQLPIGTEQNDLEVSVAMAKDGKSNPGDPKPIAVVDTDRQMSVIRFSPCGKFLLAAGHDATIRRWDVTALSASPADPVDAVDKKSKAKPPPAPSVPALPQWTGHNGWVTSLVFH